MADFAPELPDRKPEDFTRVSQGWRDSTIGSLFGDLGETLKMGVQAADNAYKLMARDEVRSKVDDVQNATIDELQMHAGVGTAKLRSDRTPEEITRFAERARMFHAGVNAGNIKESAYWAMLDTGARQLRSRYPGYRDAIDEAFKEFTGQTPANALIRELRQDAEALNRKTQDPQAIWLKQVQEMAQRGEMTSGEVTEAFTNPSKYSLPVLLAKQADINRRNADVTALTRQYELDERSGKANDQTAFTVARAEWGKKFSSLIAGTSFAKTTEEIERLQAETANRTPTKEEMVRMGQLADQRLSLLDREFESFLTTPRQHLGDQPYLTKLKPADVEAMRKQVVDMKDDIRKGILDPKSGYVGRAARNADIASDSAKERLLGNEFLATLKESKQILGDVALSALIAQGGEFGLTNIQRAIREAAIVGIANPKANTSFHAMLLKVKEKDASPELIQNIIATATKTISDPNTPQGVRSEMVRKMYGPGNEMLLRLVNSDRAKGGDVDAKRKVFHMMANPTVAKELSRVANETGDQTVWNTYAKWVVDQGYSLHAVDINTVAAAQLDAPGVKIRFNKDTFTFSLEERELPPTGRANESPGIGILRGVDNWWQESRVPGLRDAIDKVNAAITPLKDIADHQKSDREQFAISVLRTYGARMESKSDTSIMGTFLTKLSDYIYDPKGAERAPGGRLPPRSTPTPKQEPTDLTPPEGARDAIGNKGIARSLMEWMARSKAETDAQRNKDRQGR